MLYIAVGKNEILIPRTPCIDYLLSRKELLNVCDKFGLKGISYKGDDHVFTDLPDDNYNRNYVIWNKECIKIINKKTKETHYAWANDKIPEFFKKGKLDYDRSNSEHAKQQKEEYDNTIKRMVKNQPQFIKDKNTGGKKIKYQEYYNIDGKKVRALRNPYDWSDEESSY